ncbi:MAG TPA: hypothetical protein VGR96_17410 [Acidobacteriaceae bacterium]|nr:hypothetical protein [Acidobacteriaceae bacterium]
MAGTASAGVAVRPPNQLLFWAFPALSFCLALVLGGPFAFLVPDAMNYRLLALGQRSQVSSPFSARILGPAAAEWIGRTTGIGVDRGFLFLGLVCLAAFLLSTASLLRFQRVPAGIFAAVFLMPFWVKIFHNYYLPDLLHAAILAVLLLALVNGRVTLAMLLLFPAYLARESTLLAALCLAWAAWRRAPLRAVFAGIAATAAGMMTSHHFVQSGAMNSEGLSGGPYLLGKLVWGFSRNILGWPLWVNTMSLCDPIWRVTLPQALHLGAIRTVGVCPLSLWGPARVLLAWFGAFGVGPAVAACFLRPIVFRAGLGRRFRAGREPDPGGDPALSAGPAIAFRFSLLYGMISLLLAPLLGASVDRLVEYGWPFYLLALPWFFATPSLAASRAVLLEGRGIWLLPLHLAACWIAWLGFSRERPTPFYAAAGLAVLSVNLAAYAILKMPFRKQEGEVIGQTV